MKRNYLKMTLDTLWTVETQSDIASEHAKKYASRRVVVGEKKDEEAL